MLEILIIVGLSLVVSVLIAFLKGYAALWHWLFDWIEARKQRKAILKTARKRNVGNVGE